MARPGAAPVIRPNVADDSVVFGLLKLTWLNRLKNSARSCSRRSGPQVDVAQQRHVRGHVAGPVDQSASRVAVDAARHAGERHERRGVEVHRDHVRPVAVIAADVVCGRAGHEQRVLTVRLQDAVLRHVGAHREHQWTARLDPMEAGHRPAVQQRAQHCVAHLVLRDPDPGRGDDVPPIEERRPPERLEINGFGMLLMRPRVFSGWFVRLLESA